MYLCIYLSVTCLPTYLAHTWYMEDENQLLRSVCHRQALSQAFHTQHLKP